MGVGPRTAFEIANCRQFDFSAFASLKEHGFLDILDPHH
jgi:hypothetical protein